MKPLSDYQTFKKENGDIRLRNVQVFVRELAGGVCLVLLLNIATRLVTVRNSSCGKVIFSQACVKNSVHKRVYTPWADTPSTLGRHLPRQTPPGRLPPGQTSTPRQTADTPRQTHPPAPPPRDGHCIRRYASYWNAFLF